MRRDAIRRRAGGRCEYCRLPETSLPAALFHIEHVIARQHGGDNRPSNLALACHRCNLHKGPNLAGIDADTGELAPLFNPRSDRWEEHFELRGSVIVGLTPTGRTTVRVLDMNAPERVRLRASLFRAP